MCLGNNTAGQNIIFIQNSAANTDNGPHIFGYILVLVLIVIVNSKLGFFYQLRLRQIVSRKSLTGKG